MRFAHALISSRAIIINHRDQYTERHKWILILLRHTICGENMRVGGLVTLSTSSLGVRNVHGKTCGRWRRKCEKGWSRGLRVIVPIS